MLQIKTIRRYVGGKMPKQTINLLDWAIIINYKHCQVVLTNGSMYLRHNVIIIAWSERVIQKWVWGQGICEILMD